MPKTYKRPKPPATTIKLTSRDVTFIRGEKARRSLLEFVKLFWHVVEPAAPFVPGIHIEAMCEHLENIERLHNLLICMPPRHSKSLVTTVFFPAWNWLHRPADRYLISSYSLQLSTRDSIKCRNLIMSGLYQTAYGHVYQLSEDQNTKTRYETSRGGFRLSTSVEGSNVGEGGEKIICDDGNNIQDVESRAERESTSRWWDQVFCNRLNDPAKGCRIVVGQRCHPHDLLGHIAERDVSGDWTKLILPTEAGRAKWVSTNWKDPRQDGELLCPARLPAAEVKFLRNTLGSRAFNAQYNQNPASGDDAIFHVENFKYYDPQVYKQDGYRLASVDLAVAAKGDHSAVTVGDIHPDGTLYLVEVIRKRTPGLSILDVLEDVHQRLKPVLIFVEDAGFQRIVIDEAKGRRLPVRGVKPCGDKVARSCHAQAMSESARLWFPRGASWLGMLEEEMADFDGREGASDDCVDALSYLCLEASKYARKRPEEVKETPEEKSAKQRAEVEKMREAQRKAFFAGL